MKKLNLTLSILIFMAGLIFLTSVLFFQKSKSSSEKFSPTPSSRTYTMEMRLKAIKQVKKEGKKEYQFQVSSPMPISFPN